MHHCFRLCRNGVPATAFNLYVIVFKLCNVAPPHTSSFSSYIIVFSSATAWLIATLIHSFQFMPHRFQLHNDPALDHVTAFQSMLRPFRLCNTVAENFRRKRAFKLLVYASSL